MTGSGSLSPSTAPACLCRPAGATTRALSAAGIAYQLVDLTQDADAMRFVQELGYRQAPVVISDDRHWSGFQPDRSAEIAGP